MSGYQPGDRVSWPTPMFITPEDDAPYSNMREYGQIRSRASHGTYMVTPETCLRVHLQVPETLLQSEMRSGGR